jgi:hypothetical protein
MLVQRLPRMSEVKVDDAPVVRTAGGHHDVINWGRKVAEELLDSRGIRGIEGGGHRIDLARGALQGLGIATGKNQLRALRACTSGGLEPDAGASADHNNSLTQEFRFVPDLR